MAGRTWSLNCSPSLEQAWASLESNPNRMPADRLAIQCIRPVDVEAFRQGLREAGLVDGRHVTINLVWVSNESEFPLAVSGLVQRGTVSCIALPLLFVACPPRYSGTSYWLIAAAFYALAKLFEFYDHAIYSVGFILSGHALKHFAAVSACFAIRRYFQTRRPVS
jgi:hypothetical protein